MQSRDTRYFKCRTAYSAFYNMCETAKHEGLQAPAGADIRLEELRLAWLDAANNLQPLKKEAGRLTKDEIVMLRDLRAKMTPFN